MNPMSTGVSLKQDMQQRTLVIPSVPEHINQVEAFVEQLQADFNVKEDVYGNILVAVTEAVNNSIKHGNGEDAAKIVIISAQLINPFLLSLTVEDEGPGFDIKALPDPTLPENWLVSTGRGVFFIQQLADSAEYRGRGNIVEMRFNI